MTKVQKNVAVVLINMIEQTAADSSTARVYAESLYNMLADLFYEEGRLKHLINPAQGLDSGDAWYKDETECIK